MKLIKRTEIKRPTNTYNLHIRNNHNYVANGVVVSNCHQAKGAVLQNIVTKHSASIPYRFGFTGTLPKDDADALSIHTALGPIRYTVAAADLIDRKILSSLNINILQLEEDFTAEYERYLREKNVGKPPTITQFKDGYFPDFSSEKAYLQKNNARIKWIADCIELRRDEKKGNVLCLVDSIAFGRKLAAEIEGSIFVNGQDVKSPEQRKLVYDMFKDRDDLVVIATVHIASTGLNIHRIFNLFLIDLGKSFVRTIQSIGRGLRMAADKDKVVVWDICSDLKYSKRHLTQRSAYYKEANYPHKKTKIKYAE